MFANVKSDRLLLSIPIAIKTAGRPCTINGMIRFKVAEINSSILQRALNDKCHLLMTGIYHATVPCMLTIDQWLKWKI